MLQSHHPPPPHVFVVSSIQNSTRNPTRLPTGQFLQLMTHICSVFYSIFFLYISFIQLKPLMMSCLEQSHTHPLLRLPRRHRHLHRRNHPRSDPHSVAAVVVVVVVVVVVLNYGRMWPLLLGSGHYSHLGFGFYAETTRVTITIIITTTATCCFFAVNGVQLVEIRAGFRVLGAFLAAFFNLFVVLVDVFPFLFAPFRVPVVS
ncbi:hypothetical protein Hanom_Chr10g00876081 [Helianthus anomalus]